MTAEDQRGPRWHVTDRPPTGLCYGIPGTDDVWFPPMGGWPDEAVDALKAMTTGSWAGGFDSGYGDGRKAASTAAMFGVFRVFDPRPLAALVAAHDASGLPLAHDLALDLLAAVRQVLADAQVDQ